MRHEFIEQRLQNMREFAEPMLDAHMILVAINAVFVESHHALPARIAQQCCEVIGLAQKVKTVFERVSHAQSKIETERSLSDTYSCSGVVVAVGKEVRNFRPGDRVACLGSRETWYADLACISEYEAVLLNSSEDFKKQAVAGYAVLALHAIQRAQLQVGHTVCIIGFNAFGYLMVQLAKLSGAVVIVVDDKPEQLNRARNLGATHVFHTQSEDWQTELLCITQRHGVDVTIVVDSTIQGVSPHNAITITRSHGRIVLVGLHDIFINHAILGRKDIDFAVAAPHDSCYHDEQLGHYHSQMPFVQWRQRAGLQQISRLISSGDIDVQPLIARQCEVGQKLSCPILHHSSDLGMLIVCNGASDGFIMTVEEKPKKTVRSKLGGLTRFVPAMRDSVRVGIIGADSFVQDTLLPTLTRLGDVTVKAISDIEFTRAERVSKLYGVARACQLDTEILNGDLVDAIIVATNTVYHADRAMHALESNKAVFVQEPLAANFEQLGRIKQMLEERPHVPLCVDYYRSHAPFMKKIKTVLKKRSTPLMAHYRVNAQHKGCEKNRINGTGNIIGDVCHFVDLFCYLTDAQPVAVSVESIHTMRDDVFPTDNVAAQISFADGSVCSLLYTTLGHEQSGTEQLEIFFDSKTIIMHDFLSLEGYGLPAWFDESVSTPVYGRDLLIADFFAGLRENPVRTPISRERILMSNTITLIIDRLACSGGGEQKL
jgi:predicted dehydrogenase/NADPH:quinone reductase-like Zn-dependent oxidoreductase